MSLIKCPECNKEISNKASACIHCGFPLSEIKSSVIDPCEPRDGRLVIESIPSGSPKQIPAINIVCDITGLSFNAAKILIERDVVIVKNNITRTEGLALMARFEAIDVNSACYHKSIDRSMGVMTMEAKRKDDELYAMLMDENTNTITPETRAKTSYAINNKDDAVRCPKCNSNQIHSGARGFSVVSGWFGSGKVIITCLKCGHKWDPTKKSFWG